MPASQEKRDRVPDVREGSCRDKDNVKKLPKPYWQSSDGGAVLYMGDCLDILPLLEDGSVDAVVTDPPYGIGFKYESHDDTPENYGNWIWPIIERAESLCLPGSPVFVWQAMPNCRNWAGWFPREWRIFAAAKNFVQLRNIPMEYSFDPVIVWWTEGEKYSANCGCRDIHIADTASAVAQMRNAEKGHPCPRPLDQMLYVVDRFTRPFGTILDPFAGSGTTGVAAIRTGRRCILIEKEEKYCKIAAKRMAEACCEGEGQFKFEPARESLFA